MQLQQALHMDLGVHCSKSSAVTADILFKEFLECMHALGLVVRLYVLHLLQHRGKACLKHVQQRRYEAQFENRKTSTDDQWQAALTNVA